MVSSSPTPREGVIRRSLGLQLLGLYLLFIGPVIAAVLVFEAVAGERFQRDVRAADLALANTIAIETDVFLQNALRTVRELSQLPEVQTIDAERLKPLFSLLLSARQDVNFVYILDADGILRYQTEGGRNVTGIDFSYRPYFKKALTEEAPFLSSARVSPSTGRLIETAVMPLRDSSGQFIGVVGTNIVLEHLSATLAKVTSDPSPQELRVIMVDAEGQIVGDSARKQIATDAYDDFPEAALALRGESGSRISQDSADREWLRTYVPIRSAGWAVIVQRPTQLAFASQRDFRNGLLATIVVFLAGGVFFWAVLSRRFIAPLERLAEFSAALIRRTPTDRAKFAQLSDRPDQMGYLTRALTQMEQDIARRFAELSTLLDTSSAVVSSLDSQRVLNTILEQAQRLLGVDRCALIALDERGNKLRLLASQGMSEDYKYRVHTRNVLAEPHLPSIRALRTRQPVYISDTETEAELHDHARAEGYRAVAAVPLLSPHGPPAALLVYWREPHECLPEETSLIINFANHASMAIENASLFALTDEKLREQTRTLEALVQSLNDGLILESFDGRLLYCNRRICELADIAPEDAAAHSAAALRQRLLARCVSQESTLPHPELSLRHNGRTLDLRVQAFDVTDERGQLIGHGQLWLDISGDKELDRMKSALIATVSHELRTPLAAIKGNITSLLADDVEWDADSQREFLREALADTDRLSLFVTNLLDLSRIQAGTFVVNREPCSLVSLVQRAAASVGEPVNGRLIVDIPTTLPPVTADPPRIEAVLRNLIENAVKYTPPEAPIRVSAEEAQDCIVVRVADEGPGIPAEHHSRIFERFYRVDNGLTRQADGAGLGLAICKGFVEVHGGRLWLEPTDHGTIFAFSLPC
jgi:signal transduction histidine kinase